MSKQSPFRPEDVRIANYWIVQFLQWKRNNAEGIVLQRLYQALLDDWLEWCHNTKEEREHQIREKLRKTRREGGEIE